MRRIGTTATIVLASLAMYLACSRAGDATGAPPTGQAPPIREPGVLELSAAEQSDWLDAQLPGLLNVMGAVPGVRARVAGPLAAVPSPPLWAPGGNGLTTLDRDRLSLVIHTAVASNPRYGRVAGDRPRSTVIVMPGTRITRVEMTYPAPPASKGLEPGPITFDVWVCPDRETALALSWCRRGGTAALGTTVEWMKRHISDLQLHYAEPPIPKDQDPPGELASWIFPRLMISVMLAKGHKPMPTDRLTFIRGNLVVEASTIEYSWSEEQKKWLAFMLEEGKPDVMAVMRAIDAGLVRLERQGPAKR